MNFLRRLRGDGEVKLVRLCFGQRACSKPVTCIKTESGEGRTEHGPYVGRMIDEKAIHIELEKLTIERSAQCYLGSKMRVHSLS